MLCNYTWHGFISGEFKDYWSSNRSSNTRRIDISDPLVVCTVGKSCAEKNRPFIHLPAVRKKSQASVYEILYVTFITKRRPKHNCWYYSTIYSKFISWRKCWNNILRLYSHSPPNLFLCTLFYQSKFCQLSSLRNNTSNFMIIHKLILPSNFRDESHRNYQNFVAIFSSSFEV